MINPPKTLTEARRYRYFEFADGYTFNPDFCAYAIGNGRYRGAQCAKLHGHGPGGLYCPGHAKMVPGPWPIPTTKEG